MTLTKRCFRLLPAAFSLWVPLVCALSGEPQINPDSKDLLGVKSDVKSLSLLDPQRLRMHHSYTFSYFSNSRFSGSLGIYTTTLNYRLSRPLSLTLSLNYLHRPLSVFRQDNLRIKEDILPNFQLLYRPSSSFSLWINVETFPSSFPWGYQNLWREHER